MFVELAMWLAYGELQAKSARDRLFHGLLEKEIEWYDLRMNGIGALLPRLQTQIRELQLATSQPLGFSVRLVSEAVLSLAQALFRSWDLTLVSLASGPVILVAVAWCSRGMQRNYEKQQEKLTEAQKHSNSALSAIETVKCFNGQATELQKYTACVAEGARYYYRVASANALQMALIVLLSVSMFVQGFYYGGVLIREGKKNSADVMTTFFSAVGAFQAITAIIPQLLVLEKGRIAGSTLRAVMSHMQQESDSQTLRGNLEPPTCDGNIEVNNLSFAYPSRPEQFALNNITLFIPGGDLTFLIGKSGSGKSTLGQLLMRFYTSYEGHIALDGKALETLESHWLRTNVTLVEQTSLLFNDTLFQNIAFGKPRDEKATRHEVGEASQFALLQLMINDLPNGLETMVGYKGSSLSGGQRQRMALARAWLRDTPILILDECTSALDHISRTLMMEAIRRWRQGRTTIVITHDISQILPDDYAYVLEGGSLVQEGYRRHMEKLKDTPFQKFLSPEQRVETTPSGVPKDDPFECPPSYYLHEDAPRDDRTVISRDPLETQLEASENKRATILPGILQDGSPLPAWRIRANLLPIPTFAAPWVQSAMFPASKYPGKTTTSPLLSAEEDYPLSAPKEEFRNSRRTSKLMERMLDKTGQLAAQSRIQSIAAGRRRAKRIDLESISNDATSTSDRGKSIDKRLGEEIDDFKQRSLMEIMTTLWPNINRSSKMVLILGFYGATVHALSSPVFSYVLAKLLQTYANPNGAKHKSLLYSMIILALAVLDATHTYIDRFCLEYVSQRWVDEIRAEAMKRILYQPREFFDKEENSVSRITTSLDRNAEEMRNLLGRFLGVIWIAALMSVITVIWATVAQWKMTLISLSAAPYFYAVTKAYSAVSEKWENIANTAADDATAIFTEVFTNIKTVRALTLERHFVNKYIKATNHAMNVGFRRSFFTGFFYGLSDSAGNFCIAMVFYVGARLVSSGTAVEHIVQVFTMLIFTITNLSSILDYIPQIGSSKDTASRLLRLAELPQNSHERRGDTKITKAGDIIFDDLHFSYPSRPEQTILNKLNLRLIPGSCTAIVGGSGSGKSTIANLLLKLYCTSYSKEHVERVGDLTLSGRDIKRISTSSLRALVTPVSQTPTLFPATVAENIAYGLPPDSLRSSLAAVKAGATQAGVHDFISSLPQGYNTLIGDGGTGVSGGQAQRIAIARALIRKPDVLILDEATSALDVESANLVRQTIKDVVEDRSRGMTVIIITHSRDMMEMVENIVVLDHGRVVEEGAFEELLATTGALSNLLSGGEWSFKPQEAVARPTSVPMLKDVDWRKRRESSVRNP